MLISPISSIYEECQFGETRLLGSLSFSQFSSSLYMMLLGIYKNQYPPEVYPCTTSVDFYRYYSRFLFRVPTLTTLLHFFSRFFPNLILYSYFSFSPLRYKPPLLLSTIIKVDLQNYVGIEIFLIAATLYIMTMVIKAENMDIFFHHSP